MSLLPTQKVNSLAVPSWLLCAWSIWFYTPHASHSICFGIDNSEIRRQNLWKYIVNCEVPWSVSFQRNHWITGNPEWINGKSLHPVSSDIYFYTKTHAKDIAPGHVTPVGCCFHIHTHTHTSELIVRIDFFLNQRRRGDVTVLYHACVCVWYEDVSKPAVCTIHPNCCSISAGLRWSSSGLVLGQKQQQTNVSHTGSHRPEVYLSGQRNRYTGNPGRLWPYVKSC